MERAPIDKFIGMIQKLLKEIENPKEELTSSDLIRIIPLKGALQAFLDGSPQPAPVRVTQGVAYIRLVDIPTLLYEGQRFRFVVKLDDPAFSLPAEAELFGCVDLVSGLNRTCNDLLKIKSRKFRIKPNQEHVFLETQFMKISSKHGGHFVLKVQVGFDPELKNLVYADVSEKVIVKSARSKNKVQPHNLTPDNDIIDMPHIGPKYSKRFIQVLRIRKIRQLAELEPTLEFAQQIATQICQPRSALKPQIIVDLIQRARAITFPPPRTPSTLKSESPMTSVKPEPEDDVSPMQLERPVQVKLEGSKFDHTPTSPRSTSFSSESDTASPNGCPPTPVKPAPLMSFEDFPRSELEPDSPLEEMWPNFDFVNL
eukprot:c19216_g1_i2.p1 GENE.c19216_g1_i2~~c19216_g1_i2.p1  ORF type:complete len:370 (-),score=68.05 c19216_g1_i2:1133-2242(-)